VERINPFGIEELISLLFSSKRLVGLTKMMPINFLPKLQQSALLFKVFLYEPLSFDNNKRICLLGAIGDKVPTCLMSTSMFFAGFIIGYIRGW